MMRFPLVLLYPAIIMIYLIFSMVGFVGLAMVTKPLIVIWLMVAYVGNCKAKSISFLVALGFCCVGDSLLMFQESSEIFFMLGLAAFLMGHLFYIVSYFHHRFNNTAEETGTQRIRLAFPVLLLGTGWIVILLPRSGSLQFPVIAYAIAITVMVIAAISRMGRTSNSSFWRVFAGSVLFMISDSLIAFDKFLSPLPLATILIMATYGAAQYLIVAGILTHWVNEKSSPSLASSFN